MDRFLGAITHWEGTMETGFLDYLKSPDLLTPITLMAVELDGIADDVKGIRNNTLGFINQYGVENKAEKREDSIDLISLAKDAIGWLGAIAGVKNNWKEIKKIAMPFLREIFGPEAGRVSGNPESFKQMVEGFTLLPSVKEGISSGTLPVGFPRSRRRCRVLVEA